MLDLSTHILNTSGIMLDLFDLLLKDILLVEIFHLCFPKFFVLKVYAVMNIHYDFL